MKKTVQACFQLLDNSVKEFSVTCEQKIAKEEGINLSGQVGFRIIDIFPKDNLFIGQIELINDIDISTKNNKNAKIHISMIGLFNANIEIGKEKFEEMLKINGATTLSHFTRTYVQAVTSLSGMPTIITPMMNFVEFFKNEEDKIDKN